jgi:hypothetical protein
MTTLTPHTTSAGPGGCWLNCHLRPLYHEHSQAFTCQMIGNRTADNPTSNDQYINSGNTHNVSNFLLDAQRLIASQNFHQEKHNNTTPGKTGRFLEIVSFPDAERK